MAKGESQEVAKRLPDSQMLKIPKLYRASALKVLEDLKRSKIELISQARSQSKRHYFHDVNLFGIKTSGQIPNIDLNKSVAEIDRIQEISK